MKNEVVLVSSLLYLQFSCQFVKGHFNWYILSLLHELHKHSHTLCNYESITIFLAEVQS